MLRRGVKRKATNEDDGGDGSLEYARQLSNFQTLSRKRESMRLRGTAVAQGEHGAGAEQRLKERVAVEMSLVEGTAKFILACKNKRQTLEAAKTLQVARLRSDMLKFELASLRRGRGSPQTKEGKPSYACLSLSDLRIPLMWRRKDHINDVGDSRKFAVFCVARIKSQIYDSTLLAPIDRNSTDITFPDVLLFNKIHSSFELTVELYSHSLDKDSASAFPTPQKIAKSIGKKVGRTIMAAKHGSGGGIRDFENIGPKFELVASANLTLENCSPQVSTAEFYVEPALSDHNLPLFGHFCFRLAALPYCCEEEVLQGPMTLVVKRQAKNNVATQAVWASLMDWKLSLWTDRTQKEAARNPFLKININRDAAIADIGVDTLTVRPQDGPTYEFLFEEKENLHSWLVHLLQHATDHRRWKQVAEDRMEVYSPKTISREGRHFRRTRSKLVLLYNEAGSS